MTADRDSRQQLQHHTCFVAARAASDGVALSLRSLKRRRPALALALLTAVSKQSIQSTQSLFNPNHQCNQRKLGTRVSGMRNAGTCEHRAGELRQRQKHAQ